jgi:hypothetical protein
MLALPRAIISCDLFLTSFFRRNYGISVESGFIALPGFQDEAVIGHRVMILPSRRTVPLMMGIGTTYTTPVLVSR